MKWYLILSIYIVPSGGIDPCISPGVCRYQEQRIIMPSKEICQQVKAVNHQSKCIGEVEE